MPGVIFGPERVYFAFKAGTINDVIWFVFLNPAKVIGRFGPT